MKARAIFTLLWGAALFFLSETAFGSEITRVFAQDSYAVQGEVYRIVCLRKKQQVAKSHHLLELQLVKKEFASDIIDLKLKSIEILRDGLYSVDLFYVPIPVLRVPEVYSIEIVDELSKQAIWSTTLPVLKRNFPLDVLTLGKSMTNLRTMIDQKKQEETREMQELLKSFEQVIITEMPVWQYPQNLSRRSGAFADHREWRYSDGSSAFSLHYGMDYGGGGKTVQVAGIGELVLAKLRIVTGNTVVVRHLAGVFSLYYHLSELSLANKTWAQAGTQIGISGSTGLVTGPHLHWELRIQGQSADPESLLRYRNLDKEAFLGIIGLPFEP